MLRSHPLLQLAALLVAAPLLILLVALVRHTLSSEPRDALARVSREASTAVLGPDEPIYHSVPVSRRPAGDYYRATRGVLLLTDRRLMYVGLLPRDIFSRETGPDAYVRREFAIDTTANFEITRGFLGLGHAIAGTARGGRMTLLVSGEHLQEARELLAAIEHRQASMRAIVARREAVARAADAAARRAVHHLVRRGDALSTIATRYGTTVERLQELNGIEGTGIRFGQRLLVKPQS